MMYYTNEYSEITMKRANPKELTLYRKSE